MPPKNVYGKRRPVKAATFAAVLTPEKERDFDMKEVKKKSAVLKQQAGERSGWDKAVGVELQLAARDANADLEVQLTGLSLGEAPKKQDRKKTKASTLAAVLIPAKGKNVELKQEVGTGVHDEDKEEAKQVAELALEDAPKKRGRPRKDKKAVKKSETANSNTKEGEGETASVQTHNPDSKDGVPCSAPPADAPIMPKRGRPKKRDASIIVASADHEESPICAEEVPEPPPEASLYVSYVQPLFAFNSRSQFKTFAFEDFSAELEDAMTVEKIAEASFSEVYRLKFRPESPVTDVAATESVLKLIPIRTPPDAPLPCEIEGAYRPRKKADQTRQEKRERTVREEDDVWKTPVEDILGELKLLQNLSEIPGFTQFRDLTIVQGRPCGMFGQAWKDWKRSRSVDEVASFPDPNKKASYEDKQLWAVIEMADAGTDCEKLMVKGGLSTIWEVWDVFWGVVISITKAEHEFHFEHRDLHLGNICIRSKTPQLDLTSRTIFNPRKTKLGFSGLQTTVIDYTLSRANIPEAVQRRTSLSSSSSHSTYSRSSSSSSVDGAVLVPPKTTVAYLDLNKDLTLFQGDASEEYQYEIYRYMRGLVFHGNAFSYKLMGDHNNAETTGTRDCPHLQLPDSSSEKDIWAGFYPKTNLIWCHFVLHKLLAHLEDMGGNPNSLSTQDLMRNVEGVAEDKVKGVKKRAVALHYVLNEKVVKWLDPEELSTEGSVRSVAGLVDWAVGRGWLGEEDYVGEAW
ncbi:hypothetical protein P154DRAFT_238923 [Amniculicola lignicola CBS 123094]|uniref:non-specific serine/threonine protein kinase n=1 Tax=Amniculicola lignicola CBS 123094 TaxID=1392246 RepID=A0A6A5WDQ7_9PLEO|nr:hypothetical protein P154DRAFT_238923 [Amniculicola lignicola CBS 123094]